MIPFFTLYTCSPVKMWQIAEFKCSEMWSKTAAPNHLHKEGFWSFSFSSHLPGILYFLCPDRVAVNVRGLWYMGIIFRASAGGPSLTAAARFLIWYNFQTLSTHSSRSSSHKEKHKVFSNHLSSQSKSQYWTEWFFMHHSPIQVIEDARHTATSRERVHSFHFFNAPCTLSHDDSLLSRCAVPFT